MIFIALTGNMGSGKSSVAAIFKKLGAVVLDADKIAREIVVPGGKAYRLIVHHFGADILDEREQIIRKKLAKMVFEDQEKLAILNRITHPEIALLRQQKIKEVFARNSQSLVMNDIPLVFENRLEQQFQAIVVVKIDQDIQITRLLKDRKMSLKEIENRLINQIPQEKKLAKADWIIDNNGTLYNTEKQAREVYKKCLKLPQLSLQEIIQPIS